MSDGFDIDRAAVQRTFVAEGVELVAAMEAELLALETSPHDPERLRTLFRLAHTIKGNASLLGFEGLVELGHAVEGALSRTTLPVEGRRVTLLLQGVDGLRRLLQLAAAGEDCSSGTLVALRGRLERDETAPAVASGAEPAPAVASTVRVDLARLDQMLERIGEVMSARERLRLLLDDPRLSDEWDEVARPLRALEQLVTSVRMVPVGPWLRPYARMVRELAEAHCKRARLVLRGEDVEVDARVMEELRDPLTHLIRNAIDHGLETPRQRESAGKDPVGVIELSARREGGHLHLELADDGAGLDRERIVARARERGFTDAASWSERRLYALLFEPGFSTAASVTSLSGRGVGLDVVKKHVELLRGRVDVRAGETAGTSFDLVVPISVAMVSCFIVEAGGETFLVPGESVRECIQLGAGERRGTGLANLRGEALAWVRLTDLFAMPPEAGARESVVVVQHGTRRAGLVVDQLLGEQQTMVKPLGRLFQRAGAVSGSAVLGSGRVALLLDVPSVVARACETTVGER